MNKLIAALILATFLPMQSYAAVQLDFDPVELEHLGSSSPPSTAAPVLKPQIAPAEKKQQEDKTLSEKVQEAPPKTVEKSGTNWWLWGGLGLAVIVGGVVALAGGGGGGGSSPSPSASTSTVTGSW
jgi:hypothetical protein